MHRKRAEVFLTSLMILSRVLLATTTAGFWGTDSCFGMIISNFIFFKRGVLLMTFRASEGMDSEI